MQHIRDSLREHFEILEFQGLYRGTAEDVYHRDISHVIACEIFIADCTYPALGLGMEIQQANLVNKPMLILREKGAQVSRMVLGIPNPHARFAEYESPEEALKCIMNFYDILPKNGK